jgi:hypothetical protein
MTPHQETPNSANAPAGASLAAPTLLCVSEQLDILEILRKKLRDTERDYRISADCWDNNGALETAHVEKVRADTIDLAIRQLLEVERKYRNANNATYA